MFAHHLSWTADLGGGDHPGFAWVLDAPFRELAVIHIDEVQGCHVAPGLQEACARVFDKPPARLQVADNFQGPQHHVVRTFQVSGVLGCRSGLAEMAARRGGKDDVKVPRRVLLELPLQNVSSDGGLAVFALVQGCYLIPMLHQYP